jgi:competence protein ComEC
LDKLNPSVVGISCKADNEYGHPHSQMLKRLADMGIPYYITYETGNIVYSLDTQTIITE